MMTYSDTPYDDEAIGAITEVKEKLYFESSAGERGRMSSNEKGVKFQECQWRCQRKERALA